MFNRKLIMHFRQHKVMIILAVVVFVLVILSIVGLMSLESFYRKMTLATMMLTVPPLLVILVGPSAKGIMEFGSN